MSNMSNKNDFLKVLMAEFLEKRYRVERKLDAYRLQEEDMKERFVDQGILESEMRAQEVHIDDINRVADRKKANQLVGINTAKWKSKQRADFIKSIEEVQTHARELRKFQIQENFYFESPVYSRNSKEVEIEKKPYRELAFDEEKDTFLSGYLPINKGVWVLEKEIRIQKEEEK